MVQHTSCCGVKEINGLDSDAENNILSVARFRDEYSFAIVLFTDNFIEDIPDRGQDLADLIKEKKLGELVETKEVINPNSGNLIKAWLWTVDFEAVKDLVKDKFDFIPNTY